MYEGQESQGTMCTHAVVATVHSLTVVNLISGCFSPCMYMYRMSLLLCINNKLFLNNTNNLQVSLRQCQYMLLLYCNVMHMCIQYIPCYQLHCFHLVACKCKSFHDSFCILSTYGHQTLLKFGNFVYKIRDSLHFHFTNCTNIIL